MPIGVEIQLFDGASPLANLTGVQALWWDVESPLGMQRPIGKTAGANTDANGFLRLDLSKVTGLNVGASGYLILYKPNVSDHKASPTFQGKVATSNVASGVDMYYYDSEWVRPADWLPLPIIGESDQKFVGLHAVYPENANFVALSANGAYTVDWGDGTITNYAAGVVAERNINYNTAALVGSECSRGYRQAIITVTPQSAQSLTSMSLAVKHSQTGLQTYSTGWLDCTASLHATGTFSLYLSTISHSKLEQFQLLTNSTVAFNSMFSNCYSLQSVPLLNTAAGTNFSNMFSACVSLQSVPLLNTAAGTNFSSMFSSCSSLKSVPLFNTAAGTAFSSMFSNCYSLKSVPLFNTAAVATFSSMFSNCSSLQSVPLFNTAAGTNFSSMFSNCYSLKSVPLFNTAAGTNFSNMFSNCFSLQSVPLLNTAAGTNFSSMFNGCSSLEKGALSGTGVNISYSGAKLSDTELNSVYTNLGTVVGKTITVTNNWGTATDNPSIATDKGWTVTG